MRIAVVCRGSYAFLTPLLEHWAAKGYTIVDSLRGADVIFVEWANEQSIAVTQEASRKNVVIRVHGSEYFQEFYKRWNKEKVHSVLKANPTYQIPGVNVIDCGIPIDADFWQPVETIERVPGRIVMSGSFVYSKNHAGFLQILAERPYFFREVVFVGDTDARDNPYRFAETKKVLAHIEWYAKKYRLPVQIQDKLTPGKLRELYTSCEYVVSNSINEGFHLSIPEGILCGCRPLIYDWAGAREIYGLATYHNAQTFWSMVDDYPYCTKAHLLGAMLNRYEKQKVFDIIDGALFEAAREWL